MIHTETQVYRGWVTVLADTGSVASAVAFKPGTKLSTGVWTAEYRRHDLLRDDSWSVLRCQLLADIDAKEVLTDPIKETL